MTGYRCAHAQDRLLLEINERAPRRDTASDGWIGDAAHATRDSDHNPWVRLGSTGIVTARDFDHDPSRGADMAQIADIIRRKQDPRVKYLIFQGRICRSYPHGEVEAWQWGPYSGPNAHKKHLHVSVLPTRAHFDDTRPWLPMPPAKSRPRSTTAPAKGVTAPRTLAEGSMGVDVALVQRFIGGVKADGVFGPATTRAVKGYQRMRGLPADGIVGPRTWANIRGTS